MNQFQQNQPLPFQHTLIDEGEKSARANQFYQKIGNLLKQTNDSAIGLQPHIKIQIIQELDMFHEFYRQRHQQLKQNYEKLNKVNWEYANQILQYERQIQKMQQSLKQSMERNNALEGEIKATFEGKKKAESALQQKQKQISDIKKNLATELSINELRKKKVLKIKEKQNFVQEEAIQNTKVIRQLISLKQQNDELLLENEELSKQIELIKKKIKHLEADKKYQDQRLKNATLSLQLDLKLKNKQIQRLSEQIVIYERKFEEVLIGSNASSKCRLPLQSSEIDSGNPSSCLGSEEGHKKKSVMKMFQNLKHQEKTYRRIDIPNTARGHKRHGSANLDDNNLDMKVKIIKYDRSKKKF